MFRSSLVIFLLALFAPTAPGCGPGQDQNPASLWINYSQREINLMLVDFEPPPF